ARGSARIPQAVDRRGENFCSFVHEGQTPDTTTAIARARDCGQLVACLPRDRDLRSVVFVGRYDDEPRTSKGDRGLERGSDLRRRRRLWSADGRDFGRGRESAGEVARKRPSPTAGKPLGRRRRTAASARANYPGGTSTDGEGSCALR